MSRCTKYEVALLTRAEAVRSYSKRSYTQTENRSSIVTFDTFFASLKEKYVQAALNIFLSACDYVKADNCEKFCLEVLAALKFEVSLQVILQSDSTKKKPYW